MPHKFCEDPTNFEIVGYFGKLFQLSFLRMYNRSRAFSSMFKLWNERRTQRERQRQTETHRERSEYLNISLYVLLYILIINI